MKCKLKLSNALKKIPHVMCDFLKQHIKLGFEQKFEY